MITVKDVKSAIFNEFSHSTFDQNNMILPGVGIGDNPTVTLEFGYVYGEICVRVLTHTALNPRKRLLKIHRVTSEETLNDLIDDLR